MFQRLLKNYNKNWRQFRMIWILVALFEITTVAMVLEDIHIFEYQFSSELDCLNFLTENYEGLENYIKEEYHTGAQTFVCVNSERINKG